MLGALVPPLRQTVRAVVATVVPEAARLDERSWCEVDAIMETAIARRPAATRRQLRLFVRVIAVLSVLRYGRAFSSLDAAQRTRILSWLEDHPILIVRRGFWGIRTLAQMGYYGRPAAARAIGYRAAARGWAARR